MFDKEDFFVEVFWSFINKVFSVTYFVTMIFTLAFAFAWILTENIKYGMYMLVGFLFIFTFDKLERFSMIKLIDIF